MSFAVFTDSACNLPGRILKELEIHVVCFSYEMDGVIVPCAESPDDFDGHAYYEKLRNRSKVKTSLLNADTFERAFRPYLEAGQDLVYVGLSSGISGTFQSARMAMDTLREEFPERYLGALDSMGAGLGEGLLACRAADRRNEGLSLQAAMPLLEAERDRLCEFFTVGDLMHLRNTGRLSGAVALVGALLQIKPILRGDEEGHIVLCGSSRGRKKAIGDLAKLYEKKVVSPENQRVFISHGDCLEDAELLAQKIREIAEPRELIISMHEPLTGAHVGPEMLSVFFLGDNRKP